MQSQVIGWVLGIAMSSIFVAWIWCAAADARNHPACRPTVKHRPDEDLCPVCGGEMHNPELVDWARLNGDEVMVCSRCAGEAG